MPSPGRRTGVLFISSAESPGADTFIHTLIMQSLDRAQFDVHVACSAGRPDAPTPAFTILKAIPDLHLRPANFGPSLTGRSRARQLTGMLGGVATVVSFASLARYVRKHRIAILHSTDRPRDAVACAVLGRLTGAKSIIHTHLKVGDWMSGSVRTSMGRVDALIGVSEFVARSLVEYGYDPHKVYPVLNAIDLPRWDPRIDGAPVRQELRIPAGAPVIACAARLFRGKGQDAVIRAVAALRPQFPDLRLLIIGRDDRHAMRTSFTDELKALARELSIAEHVVFTGHRSDVPALFAASDIFALPSVEEPFGLVFAEAMAMKRPVVGLANGGTLEVVQHGSTGLLSEPADQGQLVANIRTLLLDPPLRARMGEAGRRRVEAHFTADRLAADMSRVYATIVAPSPAALTAFEEQVTR